jgi:hypothetical protein
MKKLMMACVIAAFACSAQAAGCLKGAAVGGVAGHFAGKHPVIGAGVGCLIGRHMEKKAAAKAQKDADVMRRPVAQNPGAHGAAPVTAPRPW